MVSPVVTRLNVRSLDRVLMLILSVPSSFGRNNRSWTSTLLLAKDRYHFLESFCQNLYLHL